MKVLFSAILSIPCKCDMVVYQEADEYDVDIAHEQRLRGRLLHYYLFR
jgi:hypothetical protein